MQLRQDAQRQCILMSKSQEQLTGDEVRELAQINARRTAISDAKRQALELPSIHSPPLPAPSPPYRGLAPPTPPYEDGFLAWCLEGNLDAVRRHMQALQGEMDDGDSLARGLYCAADRGRVDVVRYLLQQGVELHSRAVESACRRRDLVLFEVLVEHGWHPNQQVASPDGGFGVVLPYVKNTMRLGSIVPANHEAMQCLTDTAPMT